MKKKYTTNLFSYLSLHLLGSRSESTFPIRFSVIFYACSKAGSDSDNDGGSYKQIYHLTVCLFIFGKVSCSVPLFHTLHLLDIPEYARGMKSISDKGCNKNLKILIEYCYLMK